MANYIAHDEENEMFIEPKPVPIPLILPRNKLTPFPAINSLLATATILSYFGI